MDNNFLLVIDKLALKCCSNAEVLGDIKNLFDVTLRDEAFIDKNEKENFTDKKGNIKPYQKLNTSIAKLRNHMKTLKKRIEKYNGQNQKWNSFGTRKRA